MLRARRWIGLLSVAAALSLASLSAAGLAIVETGGHALAACDQALLAGDTALAVSRARDAAMAVFPWSPYPEQGYVRLTGLADSAESRGDYAGALYAWRSVRTAIVASRSEAREAARLATANRSIVRLAGRACEGGEVRPPGLCSKVTAAALAEDDLPPLPRFTLLAVGTVLLLAYGAWLARHPRRGLAS